MSEYLTRSYKQRYDMFFNDKTVKQETEYLHYFVPEFRKPLKLRMKSYDLEGKIFEYKDFVVASVPEKKYKDLDANPDNDLNNLIEQTLLEVPISKLRREIAEDIAERENGARALEMKIEESMLLSKENQLWTDKYLPKSYFELLSDDKINREVLTWLKTWDPVVFKRKLPHKYMPKKQDAILNENLKRWEINYDLGDKVACDLLRNKMILLAGPPGSGKTTLARVLATHCGYDPIEINASDERTSSILIEKIENITKTESIKKNSPDYKPSLIIIDEVDGTHESEYSGAISSLMKYIYNQKPEGKENKRTNNPSNAYINSKSKSTVRSIEDDEENKEQEEDNEDDSKPNSKSKGLKKKPGVNIKRPIIFICNDPYSRSLKELRAKALIYHFKKADTNKLMKRLLEICKKENLLLDHDIMSKICEQNDNDIRSCLNALEFLARKRLSSLSSKTLKDETFLVKKEMAKNLTDVIDDIFVIDDGKAHKGTQKAKNKKMNITNYALNFLPRNTEFSNLSEGIFLNYPKLKIISDLSRVTDLLDSLIDADLLSKQIFKTQGFELLKYTNRFIEQLVDSIYDPILPKYSTFYPRKSFVTEYISFIYQLIQPHIQNPILDQIEKLDLETAIYIMLDFGIEVLPNTNQIQSRLGTEFFQSEYNPAIERLLMFQGVTIEKRFSEKLRALVQNNYNFLKNIRNIAILRDGEEEKKEEDKEAQNSQAASKSRHIPSLIEAYENEKLKSKKRKEPSESIHNFHYKFTEGYNSAVKYEVKLSYFFRTYDPSH